jgi:2-polyprenyl-3-methyl-5-hydroxy-6-metoxy-1,4-benzoquinol methylase
VYDLQTDRDWESFAKTDPYWAVVSAEEFRHDHLTPERLNQFFDGGAVHIEWILATLRSHFGAPARFGLSVDLGCGVGRLLIPLAAASDRAIGLDVAPTMLALCKKHADERKVKNILLFRSDDQLSAVQPYAGAVDLVTSFIVLQHIPPRRGIRIIEALLKLLRSGSYGYLHITFAAMIQNLHYEAANVTGSEYGFYQRTSEGLVKLVERPVDDEQMQMNHYNVNEIMCLFYQTGITEILTRFTNHSDIIGAEFYFHKP